MFTRRGKVPTLPKQWGEARPDLLAALRQNSGIAINESTMRKLRNIEKHIKEGERVVDLAVGIIRSGTAFVLVLTRARLLLIQFDGVARKADGTLNTDAENHEFASYELSTLQHLDCQPATSPKYQGLHSFRESENHRLVVEFKSGGFSVFIGEWDWITRFADSVVKESAKYN